MALTKIPRGLLDTGIADSSDATAITIDSSENVTFAGNILKTGDLTLNVSGNIILDAGSGNSISVAKDGTAFGIFEDSSTDFVIRSAIQDKDILFKGNDGGSTITALTLDMSDAGAATFNNTVTIPKLLTLNNPDSIQAKFSPNNNSFAAVAEFYNGTSTSTPFIVGQGYATGTDNISYVWNRANAALLLGTNNTEKMRITSGGKVGIGTTFTGGNANAIMTAPLNIKLTSGSSAAVATFNLEHLNSSASIEQRLQFNAGDDATADSYSNMGYVAFGKENTYVTDDTRDSYLSFATSTNAVQAEKMRITSAGRVGIGTTAPDNLLHIKTTGSTPSIELEQDAGTSYKALIKLAGNDLEIRGSSGIMEFYNGGNNDGDSSTLRMSISAAGDATFFGASSTARLASHSYGTTLDTTTSDGSDTYAVGLDSGGGGGSTARGAGIWCYGNEASSYGGSIVGQMGAAGHFKLFGSSGGDSLFNLNPGGALGLEKTSSRFIVGGAYDTNTTYNQTSGNGQVAIFGKGAYSSCDAHIEIATSVDAGWAPIYLTKFNWSSGEDGRFLQFINYVGTSADYGTITYDGTNYAITNASDYRLKENIVDYSGGLAKLEELKVRTYNKKEGPSKGIKQEGFIAHEAATANIPGFIIGEKDAMKTNETGETVPKYQEINKEALIPYLVSAIQELSAKVKELESK